MPLFSIVIPTRNRAHLLRYALQSALEQTFDDYEIVVSDNYSSDDTAEVVQELADSRVRYVRTDRALPMPDSWEFALGKASGEWILYLCDDDAMVPNLLRDIANLVGQHEINLFVWNFCEYYFSDWFNSDLRNTLVLYPASKQVREYEGLSMLKRLFNEMNLIFAPCPRLSQSAAHRSLIDAVLARKGRFFTWYAPDFSAAVVLLSQVDRYLHVDRPLLVAGNASASNRIASLHYGGSSFQTFINEFQVERLFEHVPLRACIVHNFIAETLLRTKQFLQDSDRLCAVDLNWKTYFIVCYRELMYLQSNGIDVSRDVEEFWQVLVAQPKETRDRVCQDLRFPKPNVLRRAIRYLVDKSRLLSNVEMLLRPKLRSARPKVIRGERYGISNIVECARKLHLLAG